MKYLNRILVRAIQLPYYPCLNLPMNVHYVLSATYKNQSLWIVFLTYDNENYPVNVVSFIRRMKFELQAMKCQNEQ